MNLRVAREEVWGKEIGTWNRHVHTVIFKMDNQQGPIIQHREHCSLLHGSLDGQGVRRQMDTYVCMV